MLASFWYAFGIAADVFFDTEFLMISWCVVDAFGQPTMLLFGSLRHPTSHKRYSFSLACFLTLFWISKGSFWRATGRRQGSFYLISSRSFHAFGIGFCCILASSEELGVGGGVGKSTVS